MSEIATSSNNATTSSSQEIDPVYRVVDTLGEGAFGEVLLVVNIKLPQVAVAMKKLTTSNAHQNGLIRKEYLIQKKLSDVGHDNVIRMIGMRTDASFHYLFLEYADGGELFDKIEPDVGIAPEIAQFYFRQMIQGLEYIHENNIVHRDIKPENLLLTTSHVLKISDFGMATLYRNNGTERLLDMSCGTVPYAAPEVCAGRKYRGPPIDVWSCGIVLVAMLSGELPWERASDVSYPYLQWLSSNNLDENPWKKVDVRVLCILRKILTDNVEKRATIEQVKADPWFTHDYGKLETPKNRPLKRARVNDENYTTCTQQAETSSCSVKRPHLDTPEGKSFLTERQNASFSQPTRADDLLLTQHIDMSQNNSNLLERMVCRMTRFCVNTEPGETYDKVAKASEHSGFDVRRREGRRLLVTYRECSMMVTMYAIGDVPDMPRVMVDFRRSRGDGLQFKKMFLEVRNRMHQSICSTGNTWLADYGYVPKHPKLINEETNGNASVSNV
ncbi:CBN-CHK-1 protein [Caenorhabditis brenneri]|uniref:non-specific serine/threonine protein kinase n=1 Tax=Caenorhabditis brenneri TaxID=135651 RepID=G0PEE5_CAEBE|nr:CBN-CHK-1 protein [Caenorhabditis brenneri]